MSYQPVSVTATLSNTIQTTPGFVELKDKFVALPWSYIQQSDVKVAPASTPFTFNTASTVKVDTIWAVTDLPQTVTFSRETSFESLPATFYPGALIRAEDLNANFEKLFYKMEEAI